MLLSRTAGNLFWLARYMERMDFVARLLEVAQRMAGVSLGDQTTEWHSALIASGAEGDYKKKYDQIETRRIVDFLVRDLDNPSSILSCLTTARGNARAVRASLTSDTWEAINGAWLEGRGMRPEAIDGASLGETLDWVKVRAVQFSGAYSNSMLRNDAFWFTRMGTFLERADNTARILDVKYHVLLPRQESVGGVLDYYQWSAILRAVSALRSYHWIYTERIQPWNVAELLILRAEMPRSLAACFTQLVDDLERVGNAYGGRRGECHRLAGEMNARLRFGRIESIFQVGLHEFLTEYIERSVVLGDEITKLYLV